MPLDVELVERRKRESRKIFSRQVLGELDRIDKLQTDFRAFAAHFWHIVDPAPYEATWVTDAIADHLQAVVESKIRRLLINIFFRSAKTTFAGVLLPAWAWLQDPKETMLYLSHTSRRALSAAEHSRDLMKSAEFRAKFGNKFTITKDTAGLIENNHRGSRVTLSAKSAVTGEGGNLNFFDDPNDVMDVESPVERDKMNNRFDNLSTRSNNFALSRWIIIQQRTHPKDVSGHVDELGGLGFEKLIIPLEYQGKKYVTSLGALKDPRNTIGEIADERRFPIAEVASLHKQLGYRFSGQANQEPTTPEGNAIKIGWYKPYCQLVDLSKITVARLAYDIGFSPASSADWTWGALKIAQESPCPFCRATVHTLWQHFGKWDNADRRKNIGAFGLQVRRLMEELLPNVEWLLTEEAGIGGSVSVVEEDIRLLQSIGLPAESVEAKKQAKPVRAIAYLSSCQSGFTKFYAGNQFADYGMSNGTELWIKPFFEEVTPLIYSDDGLEFKGGKDDPIDGEVMAHDGITAPPTNWSLYSPVLNSNA